MSSDFRYRLQEEAWVGGPQNENLARIYLQRIGNFLDSSQWKDVNLNKYRWYEPITGAATKLSVYAVLPNDLDTPLTSEQARAHRPTFEQVMASSPSFRECKVGDVLGPSWSTHWIKVETVVPQDFHTRYPGATEDSIHFIFDCGCEGLVFDLNGTPIQALTGSDGNDRRVEFVLGRYIKPTGSENGNKFVFYVEVACNGMFGVGDGVVNPPEKLRRFKLARAEPVYFNKTLWDLYHDLYVVYNLAKELGLHGISGQQALRAANRAVNVFDIQNPKTWEVARKILHRFITGPSKGPAERPDQEAQLCDDDLTEVTAEINADTKTEWTLEEVAEAPLENDPIQTIFATGHCHIDTAWLWPYAETRRKVIRSWVSQLELAERYPKHKFVLSQAQQMQWLLEDNPKVFERLKDAVKRGIFEPIGGTWVEMDANIPSGEAFVRQFLLGQRFFLKHFGFTSETFWLPDTFGYSAQTPQFLRQARMKYFVTQKISWNNVNAFPLQSFVWRGIDGSEVLAHFPPADTYTNDASVPEIFRQTTKYRERAVAGVSLMLFGNGDGGGGPQAQMLERIQRYDTCPGFPRVKLATIADFFKSLQKRRDILPRYTGELYLELHRGTYTSQAAIKLGNFLSQVVLREIEMLYGLTMSSFGSQLQGSGTLVYPSNELENLWRQAMLNQFHDVLPGSCIGLVVDDAVEIYRLLIKSAADLIKRRASQFLALTLGKSDFEALVASESRACINLTGFSRCEIVPLTNQHSKDMFVVGGEGHDVDVWRGFGYMLPAAHHSIETEAKASNDKELVEAHRMYFKELRTGMQRDILGTTLDDTTDQLTEPPQFVHVEVQPMSAAIVPALASHLSRQTRAGYLDPRRLKPTKSQCIFSELSDDSALLTPKPATKDDIVVLENSFARYEFSQTGRLLRAIDKREILSPPGVEPQVYRAFISASPQRDEQQGNTLWMYTDVPLFWDAWDVEIYHQQRRRPLEAYSSAVVLVDPLRCAIIFRYRLHPVKPSVDSSIPHYDDIVEQIVYLDDTSPRLNFEVAVDWRLCQHECLKVSFPMLFPSTATATYEAQFGHITRPTTINSTQEQAMFEVCGQRWATLNDGTFGVAVLTQAKHGFSARHDTLSITLLRSPTGPDENCDRHGHRIRYALLPYGGSVAQSGLNRHATLYTSPLIHTKFASRTIRNLNLGAASHQGAKKGLIFSSHDNVVIDVIKRAEPAIVSDSDPNVRSGAGDGKDTDPGPLVLRVHEAMGIPSSVRIYVSEAVQMEFKSASRCDILESKTEKLVLKNPGDSDEPGYYAVSLNLNPFEFATIMLDW